MLFLYVCKTEHFCWIFCVPINYTSHSHTHYTTSHLIINLILSLPYLATRYTKSPNHYNSTYKLHSPKLQKYNSKKVNMAPGLLGHGFITRFMIMIIHLSNLRPRHKVMSERKRKGAGRGRPCLNFRSHRITDLLTIMFTLIPGWCCVAPYFSWRWGICSVYIGKCVRFTLFIQYIFI